MNLFFDIETIPDQRKDALQRAVELVKAPANYKKPEAIEKYRREHAAEAHAKTALKGIYGELCSIAWAFDDDPVLVVTRTKELSEKDLLEAFFASVKGHDDSSRGSHSSRTWIGHNVIEFDLRFLKQRALIKNVRPPFSIPADARHGQYVFDTMKEWAGWKGYVKLDDLCKAFGLKGKGDIDGSMVGDLWAKGQYDIIMEYNKDDVEKTREVYRRMVWA